MHSCGHHPVLAKGDDIPEDDTTDDGVDAEDSEVPEERHWSDMKGEKVRFYYTKCCDLPFIEEESGRLLERFPQPYKLGNNNTDRRDHVNHRHMFSPGITKQESNCKLCMHVSQIDENQNNPTEIDLESEVCHN